MSEDEAFIRAIVDSPGDDTPRLVYADWLDDRSDPRGPYLRAEQRWAKKKTNASLMKLRKIAGPLDAVWAARVARPPLGVCCDDFEFTHRGPDLTCDDVRRVEDRLSVRFPAAYAAFLLNFNGGSPKPRNLPDPDSDSSSRLYEHVPEWLAARRPAKKSRRGSEDWHYEIENERDVMDFLYREAGGTEERNPLVADFVPIAGTVPDRGYMLLAVRGPRAGAVVHFTEYRFQTQYPEMMDEIAPTFPHFLSELIRPVE